MLVRKQRARTRLMNFRCALWATQRPNAALVRVGSSNWNYILYCAAIVPGGILENNSDSLAAHFNVRCSFSLYSHVLCRGRLESYESCVCTGECVENTQNYCARRRQARDSVECCRMCVTVSRLISIWWHWKQSSLHIYARNAYAMPSSSDVNCAVVGMWSKRQINCRCLYIGEINRTRHIENFLLLFPSVEQKKN